MDVAREVVFLYCSDKAGVSGPTPPAPPCTQGISKHLAVCQPRCENKRTDGLDLYSSQYVEGVFIFIFHISERCFLTVSVFSTWSSYFHNSA